MLAVVLVTLKRYAEAEPYLLAALRINPSSDATLHNYGLVLKALGRPKEALALDQDTYSGYTVVNADPFSSYVSENPNDYGNGVYNGISVIYTPLRGFQSVTINVVVSNFAG